MWYGASFWLDDCEAQTPALIAVGTLDTIINPRAASDGFGSWRARRRGVRVLSMEGMGHGEWLVNDAAADSLVAAVHALRLEAATVAAADGFQLTW